MEAYTHVIETLDQYRSAIAKLANVLSTLKEAASVSPEAKAEAEKDCDDAVSTLNEAARAWIHAKSLAHLCCDERAVEIVESLKLLPEGTPVIHESVKVMHSAICGVAKRFNEAARRDLGYEVVGSADPK